MAEAKQHQERLIDYDRGALIMVHPGTGMDVFMYVDQPGVYMNAHGHAVADNIAREAGYDVEKLGKERVRRERIAAASAAIDQEFHDTKDQDDIVVRCVDGWKLVSFGFGRHNVVDPDGNVLNKMPLSLEMGEKLFASFAPQVEEKKEESGNKKSK